MRLNRAEVKDVKDCLRETKAQSKNLEVFSGLATCLGKTVSAREEKVGCLNVDLVSEGFSCLYFFLFCNRC